jgi:hypothetical protein
MRIDVSAFAPGPALAVCVLTGRREWAGEKTLFLLGLLLGMGPFEQLERRSRG